MRSSRRATNGGAVAAWKPASHVARLDALRREERRHRSAAQVVGAVAEPELRALRVVRHAVRSALVRTEPAALPQLAPGWLAECAAGVGRRDPHRRLEHLVAVVHPSGRRGQREERRPGRPDAGVGPVDRSRAAASSPFDPSLVREAVERGPGRDHAHAVAVGELALAREVVAVEPEPVLDLRAHLQVDLVLEGYRTVERHRLRARGHENASSGSASTGLTR